MKDKNSKPMRVTSGCLHSFEEFPEFPQNVKPNSSLDPKDSKKELVPDQLYFLANHKDFLPLVGFMFMFQFARTTANLKFIMK